MIGRLHKNQRRWAVVLVGSSMLPASCRFGYELLQSEPEGVSLGGMGGQTAGFGAAGGATGGENPGGQGGVTIAPSCDDGLASGDESDVDCGGSCAPCGPGLLCSDSDDCDSGVCSAGRCQVAACTDGVLNQGEEQIDCGGAACPCCNPGAFAAPEKVSGIDIMGNHYGPVLSADVSTVYFSIFGPDTQQEDLYVATRSDRGIVFENVQPVVELNTADNEGTPFLSASGLSLYFFSDRPGDAGDRDLYVATRSSPDGTFGSIEPLSELNSTAVDQIPSLSTDELVIVFASQRPEGLGFSDLWTSQRTSVDDPFDPPTLLAELSSPFGEDGPSLSTDGLTVFFSKNDASTDLADIVMATRTMRDEAFSPPVAIDVVNSSGEEFDPFLTDDGRELFFASDRDGAFAIYRAERECL